MYFATRTCPGTKHIVSYESIVLYSCQVMYHHTWVTTDACIGWWLGTSCAFGAHLYHVYIYDSHVLPRNAFIELVVVILDREVGTRYLIHVQ